MNELSEKEVPLRVSIVEDDAAAREILVRWLAGAKGFQFISEFGSAEDSLENLPSKTQTWC